jgi:HSP20 family molecular chaperone IbpA
LAPHDFQLCLRLGFSLVYEELQAELPAGVLTVTIPKKTAVKAV